MTHAGLFSAPLAGGASYRALTRQAPGRVDAGSRAKSGAIASPRGGGGALPDREWASED